MLLEGKPQGQVETYYRSLLKKLALGIKPNLPLLIRHQTPSDFERQRSQPFKHHKHLKNEQGTYFEPKILLLSC